MAAISFRAEFFEREDESADGEFYADPRLVVHIDEGAIRAAAQLYGELLPSGGEILDLMSSWRSHLPEALSPRRVVGLGMNAVEMSDNPQLTETVVHNLNDDPHLPLDSDGFDGALCTVSVQYLVHPIEVFAEVNRVLRVGAPFVVTFSNRCFPTKAVRIWRSVGDREHIRLVAAYFQQSGGWRDLRAGDRSTAGAAGDPLFAVYAWKADPRLTQSS